MNAGERLTSPGSSITAEALQSDRCNITVNARNRIHLADSAITPSVGNGKGGNINIDPEFVILDNSRIVPNAFGGQGGNIQIVADQFIATPDSIVDASSRFGADGQVVITSPDTNMIGKIATLTAKFLDPSALFKEQCAARYIRPKQPDHADQQPLRTRARRFFLTAPTLPDEHNTPANGSPAGSCSESQ